MKRYFALAAAVAVTACVREIPEPVQVPTPGPTGREVTLVADLGDGTKTVYNADENKIYWKPSENLSLFYGSGDNGGSKFTSTNAEDARVANFTGSIDVITAGGDITEDDVYFWGVYPYRLGNSCNGSSITTMLPTRQTAVAGTFADNLYITAGRSTGLKMGFKAVCSALVFNLGVSDVTSVTLRGNDDEYVAGTFVFDFDENGNPDLMAYETVESNKEITLTAPDGGSFAKNVDYYIIVLPRVFQHGLTLTFRKNDGSFAIKKYTSRINMARNTFLHADNVTSGIEFTKGINLGGSVMWATYNLGASCETDWGDYFAWGETSPRTTFFENDYSLDLTDCLDMEHDAAHANWGGKWRMPTSTEWQELTGDPSIIWEYQADYNSSGVPGFLLTYIPNKHKIFLPLSGNRYDDAVPLHTTGCYWSTDYSLGHPLYLLVGNTGYREIVDDGFPSIGMSIRPVCPIEPTSIVPGGTWTGSTASVKKNHSLTLDAEVRPASAADRALQWIVGDETVLSLDSWDDCSATLTGVAQGRTTVTAATSNGKFYTWTVDVLPDVAPFPTTVVGQDELWINVFCECCRWDTMEEMYEQFNSVEFIPGTQRPAATTGMDVFCINSFLLDNEYTPIYAAVDLRDPDDSKLKFYTTADSFRMSDCENLFYGFSNLRTVTGLEYLDVSNVSDMHGMFQACRSLTSLDLSNFVITPYTDMDNMFANCDNMQSLTFGPEADFSGRDGFGYFLNMGHAAGWGSGVIWTTFHCTETQWDCLSRLFDSNHFAAGRYVWADQQPTSVSVSGEYTKMGTGWTQPLHATVLPQSTPNRSVTWSSTRPDIAYVDENGIVTAVSAGSAVIRATTRMGGVVGDYPVTVTSTTMGVAAVTGDHLPVPGFESITPRPYTDAGRTSCAWVQLWAGGPKFAVFNVGATVDTYDQPGSGASDYTLRQNIGGLWSFGHPEMDIRAFAGTRTWNLSDYTAASVSGGIADRMWGANWREPTSAEMSALIGNCVWTYCNGTTTRFCEGCTLPGYKVRGAAGSGYEDNVIFLPTTGYYSTGTPGGIMEQEVVYPTSRGCYWTSTGGDGNKAYCLDFWNVNGQKGVGQMLCRQSLAVRPVLAE